MGDTYKKSTGNAGIKGTSFQLDLLSIFILNAIRLNSKDWKLSTENEKGGKFDDLILEYDDGTILLQAKHKDNKKITWHQLFSTNSNNEEFSLPKYFLSYLDVRTRFPIKHIIICTNTQADSTVLNVMNTNNVNEENFLYYQNGCSFFTFRDTIVSDLIKNARIYHKSNPRSKNVDETLITVNNASEFLKHLRIYLDYPSGYRLEKAIEKVLTGLRPLNNILNDISYRDLHQKVKNWFEEPKGEYLTGLRAKAIFCEIISDKYREKLEIYNIFFKDITSLNIVNSEKRIFHVVAERGRLLHLMKTYQALQHSTTKILYVGSDYKIDVQKEIIKAFEVPRYIFLIIASSAFSEESAISDISKILQRILKTRVYKKVIFVTARSNDLVQRMKSKNDNDYEVFDESLTLNDLSDDSQDILLKKESIIFQGEEITVGEILREKLSDVYKTCVNSDILEKIMIGEKLTVGTRLTDLEENTLKYYMDRKFKRITEIIEVHYDEKEKSKDGSIIIKQNKFDKIQNMEWITNKIVKDKEVVFSEEDLVNLDDKMILISDSAGTGKTTVLKNLSNKIKRKNNMLWVIRIEINLYTNILSDCLRNKRSLTLLELLKCNNPMELTTELEIFLFSLMGIIVVMLDGIDEVCPDYTDLILDLLLQCQNVNYLKNMFVTARPHIIKTLHERLKITSFKLVPFTKQNKVDFLVKYWIDTLKLGPELICKCERYAKTLMEKVSYWITDTEFLSSPLHANILAAVFLENNGSDEWEGVKEYLNTSEEDPKLPKRMNMSKLYQMFIENKKEIFVKKINPKGNNIANQAVKKQFEDCLAYHKSLALKNIFYKEKCILFSCYKCNNSDDDETVALKMGIVEKSNKQLTFIHWTFAEYFVAECVVKELQRQNTTVEFQELLINYILWEEEFKMIRGFLDGFLYDRILSLNTDSFRGYMSHVVDNNYIRKCSFLQNLAIEGHIEIIRFVLKIINFKIVKDRNKFLVKVTTFFVRKKNTLTYLKQIAKRDGLNMKDLIGCSPVHNATAAGRLNTLEFLIEMGADIDCIQSLFAKDAPLHMAVNGGFIDVVKFLITRGANINITNKVGYTPLIYAIRACSYDLVELLVTLGANINISSNKNTTVLHFAARKGLFDIFQFLVKNGADIHSVNILGNTVLHFAAEGGSLELVEFLLNHNMDINITDIRGNTALHFAIRMVDYKMVTFLVNHGADINIADREGRTALHLAVISRHYDLLRFFHRQEKYNTNDQGLRPIVPFVNSKGSLKMVEFFIKQGANVNVKNWGYDTPLHLAAFGGSVDIVKLLLENGADINATNKKGNTALHLAAVRNNCDVVELLFKYGASLYSVNNNGDTFIMCNLKSNRLRPPDLPLTVRVMRLLRNEK